MGSHLYIMLLVIIVSSIPKCLSWGWFSSSTETHSTERTSQQNDVSYGYVVAEFSMDGLRDKKGIELVENAKNKLVGPNSCWQNSYQQLFAGCTQILANEEKRSRFAWHLSDCFQKDSGRPSFPFCHTRSAMVNCLEKLNDNEHQVYLEFLLETNSICYQLQSHTFKQKMERLVNDLKNSAEYTEQKLDIIQERTHSLLESSSQIHDSLSLIDIQVKSVDQTTKVVSDEMDALSKHSQAVFKQSRGIADFQKELQKGQARMNEKLEEGMGMLQDAYSNLGQEVNNLISETSEIENHIGKVGEAMSLRMQTLQNTADDIENKAGKSLDKQQQLLDGQSTALKGLQILTEFQSEALQESRSSLERLVEYGNRQQEELRQRQEQFNQVHDHLVENSKSILAAQEAFESKQASMFVALEKLFALHNAMLLESRTIKAFFIYSLSIFIIYMFTSTKQTYTVRAILYVGLCATFFIELLILRLASNNIERQSWMINFTRSLYVLLASVQFVYAIYTYRDYEVLNHQMIMTLIEKVNVMQKSRELSMEMDSDINWPSWIETELVEEIDSKDDPNYLPLEEVAENSTTTSMTKKYNLRSHQRH